MALIDALRAEELAPAYAKASFRAGAAHEVRSVPSFSSPLPPLLLPRSSSILHPFTHCVARSFTCLPQALGQWSLSLKAYDRAARVDPKTTKSASDAKERVTRTMLAKNEGQEIMFAKMLGIDNDDDETDEQRFADLGILGKNHRPSVNLGP